MEIKYLKEELICINVENITVSKQLNITSNEARLFPFKLGEKIELQNKDFWKFPLDWVLGVRLTKEQFEWCDGFYSATIQISEQKIYQVSIFEKDFKKVFPTRKGAHFNPEKCFTECSILPKDGENNNMVGLDGIETDDIYMTITGPDFPRKLICEQLSSIKEQLRTNFDQAKLIATLAMDWCDSERLNECESDL